MAEIMKNISKAEVFTLKDQISYQDGQVVSKTLAQNRAVSVTLFSFDKHEEISTLRAATRSSPAWTAWAVSPSTVWIICCMKANPSSCPRAIRTRCLARKSSKCCWSSYSEKQHQKRICCPKGQQIRFL